MLEWTITFVVLAIITAIFGFGSVSSDMAPIAKVLFFVFLALVIISFLKGRTNKV